LGVSRSVFRIETSYSEKTGTVNIANTEAIKLKVTRWLGYVLRLKEKRKAHNVLGENPEAKGR